VTTLIAIEHPARQRRGLLLRRGSRLGEASPLPGRSRETIEDVTRAFMLGETAPASLDFALWALEATVGTTTIRSQVLLDDPRTAIDEARTAVGRGQRAFKLKIRSAADADLALALRELHPALVLRVDANQSFASAERVPWDVLARARVEWIEEPCVGAGSLVGTPVPIALDESVARDANQALADVADGRAAALVLKPTLLGATETLRIAERCRALGGRVIVSHAFESEVARRAAEELARRIAPAEIHGLFAWAGIDGYRVTLGGAPLRSLTSAEGPGVDSALG
jgi:O-succinylbenzoate synthase